MKKCNNPDIRFQAYIDDWKEQRLEKVVEFSKGKGYSKKDLQKSGRPIILYGRLYTDYEFVIDDVDTFTEEKDGSVISKGNEVIIPASGESAADIARASAVTRPGVLLGGDLNILKPADCIQSEFLALAVSNGGIKKKLARRAQGGTIVHLHNSDMVDLKILYPSKREQKAIARLFHNIDELLTVQKNKIDKLIQIKKGMLDKLFIHDDHSTVPSMRFGKFSVIWKQVTLGEIVEEYVDPVPTPQGGYERLGIRSYAKGTFHSFVSEGRELETAQMHRVAAHKLIVNITFAWEHAVAITDEKDEGKLVSHRFPQFEFHEGMVPEFFRYIISDEKFRHHLWLSSPGGAGRNKVLKIDEMLEYRLRIPCYEEQKQIADFMDSLENLIDLYGQKLEQLQHIKSALLDKMFVS